MILPNLHLSELGIPQDVIDAAVKVGVDAKTLVSLCIKHTVDAARDLLLAAASKLPSK